MSSGASNRRLLLLFLGLLALAAAVVFMARNGGSDQADSWETDYSPTGEARQYSLEDVRVSSHMNVTVYNGDGQPSYLGWSGGSRAMEEFVTAVAGATPVEGEPDETFTDLIVFYFADGGSLAAAYSRQQDLLMFNGRLFRPAGEIGQLIVEGEERYN